jgi:hypothetical protein
MDFLGKEITNLGSTFTSTKQCFVSKEGFTDAGF